ncbi:hypothetical protein H9P43_000729 [Blastocladiella emersonii ATCC 22665]|nr:hypothetical protein H9P43_000729 [Blastocladiella emersonii ATCC 22665]
MLAADAPDTPPAAAAAPPMKCPFASGAMAPGDADFDLDAFRAAHPHLVSATRDALIAAAADPAAPEEAAAVPLPASPTTNPTATPTDGSSADIATEDMSNDAYDDTLLDAQSEHDDDESAAVAAAASDEDEAELVARELDDVLLIEEDDVSTRRPTRLPSPLRAQFKADQERRRNSALGSSGGDGNTASAPRSGRASASSTPRGSLRGVPAGVHFAPDTASNDGSRKAGTASAEQPRMRHIDREELYTSVEYRINYVSDVLDFGEQDKALIAAAAPLLADYIPDLVDKVYGRLLSYDIMAKSFMHRMENYSGEVVRDLSQLNVNSEQIKFRRNMLKRYLVCTMLGMNDQSTLHNYLDWVALIHTKNKSKHSAINVEYIHLGAMLAFLSQQLTELITQLHLPAEVQTRTIGAFSKLFWIQNDLFALYYTHDGLDIPGHLATKHGVDRPVTPLEREAELAAKKQVLAVTAGAGVVATAVGFAIGWLLARK